MPFVVASTVGYLTDEALAYLHQNDCEVTEHQFAKLTEDEFCQQIKGIDAVIAGGDPYTERVFQAADKLKIVARTGAGYDTVNVPAATKRGIWVTTTPGATSDAVADLTLGLMLSLLRNIPGMIHDMKHGKWEQYNGRELGSMTVGIVGTGSIGRAVIKRVAAFGSKILGYDVQPNEDLARYYDVQYLPLDDLLRQADIVSLHVSLNPDTKGLIDARLIKLMKKNAYLLNTSRPAVIDKQALIAALKAHDIAGAAIDVHDPSPAAPDDPLVHLDNVLATPWVAYKTQDSIDKMCIAAAHDVVAVLHGERPKHPVNQI